MDDLFRMLVLRAPQSADSAPTVQLPLGKPTQFQLEEAKQRGPANGASAQRAAAPQVDAPQASAARMAVATTAAIPAAPATPAAPGDRAAVATTRLSAPKPAASTMYHPQYAMWALAAEYARGPLFLPTRLRSRWPRR